jgi:hypothetical protein
LVLFHLEIPTIRLNFKGDQYLFQREKEFRDRKSVQRLSENSRGEFMRTYFERVIEFQRSAILKLNYYGHHEMSIKFKYR